VIRIFTDFLPVWPGPGFHRGDQVFREYTGNLNRSTHAERRRNPAPGDLGAEDPGSGQIRTFPGSFVEAVSSDPVVYNE
jgi:hypothetical protein